LINPLSPLLPRPTSASRKDIDQILENITKFSEYVVAADYDNIAASYTKDGKIFPNRLNIISGRADVRKYWVLPEGVRTIAHKITPVEIKVKGKEAYDYGYYEGTTRRANGEEVSWRGKYVIIWRKVGKEWKIYLDIWNSVDG
jgi:ketosteroid isomerase-like protein